MNFICILFDFFDAKDDEAIICKERVVKRSYNSLFVVVSFSWTSASVNENWIINFQGTAGKTGTQLWSGYIIHQDGIINKYNDHGDCIIWYNSQERLSKIKPQISEAPIDKYLSTNSRIIYWCHFLSVECTCHWNLQIT